MITEAIDTRPIDTRPICRWRPPIESGYVTRMMANNGSKVNNSKRIPRYIRIEKIDFSKTRHSTPDIGYQPLPIFNPNVSNIRFERSYEPKLSDKRWLAVIGILFLFLELFLISICFNY